MPLLCMCLVYVFVGLLVYPFVLCVAVFSVSAAAEAWTMMANLYAYPPIITLNT
jgi:hypothetical protein